MGAGVQLFQYVDDAGQRHPVDSADVNDYLQAITGQDFTSKDFRTWAGTACTAQILCELGEAESPAQTQENIREAIRGAANHLGNRFATCRNFYVHPAIPQAYAAGWLVPAYTSALQRWDDKHQELTADEYALISVLTQGKH